MALVHQVLSLPDVEEVYAYADKNLRAQIKDDDERMLHSWSVKWRKEALDHYMKLGWSFITRDEQTKATQGFFLAQPFLFFRGQTQTLWVEHIESENEEVTRVLVDIAVRVAREKHLQRVLFADADNEQIKRALAPWNPEPLANEPIAVVKTTKG